MLLSFLDFLLWLQPAATGSGGATSGGGSGTTGGGSQYCLMQAGIMGLVLLFTYFFMIRPEQKRRAEADDLMKSLRKGMKVRTTSGILGEIINITEHEVILGVADKVRINVLRSHIAGPEPESRESGAKAEVKKEGADKGEPSKDESAKGKKPDETRS